MSAAPIDLGGAQLTIGGPFILLAVPPFILAGELLALGDVGEVTEHP